MGLFRRGKIEDERIVSTRNKLYREAYILAMALCVISIVVKYCLYGANIEMVTTEIVVLLLPALYYGVRSVRLGIYADEVEVHDRSSKLPFSLKNIMIGGIFGVAIALFFGIRSAILYGNASNSLWYFFILFVASFMIYIPCFVGVLAVSHALAMRNSRKALDGTDSLE